MRVATLVGGALGAVSSFFPIGSDEGAWIAIGERLSRGGTLYVDAIDNKSPVVFAVVRALDRLPGPFEGARAGAIALLSVLLIVSCSAVCRRLGLDRAKALAVGCLVAVSAALQSVFLLTIESLALVLLVAGLWAIAGRRALAGAAVAALALCVDPRAVFLLPGVVWLARTHEGPEAMRRALGGAAAVAAVWTAIVMAQPDWRFALVELNLTSRTTAPLDIGDGIAAMLQAMIVPVAGAVAIRRGIAIAPRLSAGAVLATGGVLAAVLSVQPFHHYWTLTLAAIPVLAASPARPSVRISSRELAIGMVLAASVVPASHAARTRADRSDAVREYRAAARALRDVLGPRGRFLQFAAEPYLVTFLPGRHAGRSPLLGYLVQPTGRRDDALAELDHRLGAVDAVADDGGLSVPEQAVLAPFRTLRAIFDRHAGEFPCGLTVGSITLRARAEACPPGWTG